ncbi:hypothetical protein IG631_08116 [Alternaria alternata]|nr:hypothetical protein IG631_08116 [Alternaria alternata]
MAVSFWSRPREKDTWLIEIRKRVSGTPLMLIGSTSVAHPFRVLLCQDATEIPVLLPKLKGPSHHLCLSIVVVSSVALFAPITRCLKIPPRKRY